jgi:hypothetical protein
MKSVEWFDEEAIRCRLIPKDVVVILLGFMVNRDLRFLHWRKIEPA